MTFPSSCVKKTARNRIFCGTHETGKRNVKASAIALLAIAAVSAGAQAPVSGKRAESLVIRNATIVDGAGTPAIGPADIVIRGNRITEIAWLDPVSIANGRARRPRL